MMKLVITAWICCVLLLFAGCDRQQAAFTAPQETAQIVADAFSSGDMDAIAEAVFGKPALTLDPEIAALSPEEAENHDGILGDIFKRVTINVQYAALGIAQYEIQAPDMTDVFAEISLNAAEITEDTLREHIRTYAEEAPLITTTVRLPYQTVEGETVFNYQDEAFINAVTGGFLSAYQALYAETLELYMKGLDEQ